MRGVSGQVSQILRVIWIRTFSKTKSEVIGLLKGFIIRLISVSSFLLFNRISPSILIPSPSRLVLSSSSTYHLHIQLRQPSQDVLAQGVMRVSKISEPST